MNTIINFELAKLLKEKEFDNIECKGYYHICDGYTKGYAFCYSNVNKQYENAILTPIIAEVVMWLYENHGIWINVDWMLRTKPYNSGFYCFLRGTNKPLNQDNFISINTTKSPGYEVFDSPTEAYEAAIDYTLNYLI